MTNPVAAPKALPALAPDDKRVSKGMPLLDGWIDFSGLSAAGTPPVDRHDPVSAQTLIEHPGLRLAFDSLHADHYCDADGMTICIGAPCIGGMGNSGDARAIARAYRERGEKAWISILGRFAIVHLDLRHRAVFLVTDRFGVRPLCYARHGTNLWFSDRADAIARHHPARISPQAIYDYLYFHVIPAPRTIFEGVSRLAPARWLRVDAAGVRETDTWCPRFSVHVAEPVADLAKRFATLLEQAVGRELDGGAVGAFLSGGTDSSTVLGMLCRKRGRAAAAFSIGFEDESYDEMAYARIAARHFGAEHHEYYVTPDDLLRDMPAVAAYYDQPFGNSSALPAFCCAKLAQAHGIDKMLAGDGGDELFGGNTRYAKQKVFESYYTLPGAVRHRILEPAFTGDSPARRLPLLRKIASYVEQARVPMPDRTQTYNLLDRFGTTSVFTPTLLAQVDSRQPLLLQRSVYEGSAGAAFVDRMLAFDWRFTLADTDLPKVSATTRMAGLAVGFPMLDDDLVDFSLALPASYKVRGLTLRWFFKRALQDFLPREIIRKKKHGFGLPFGPWLLRHDGLRNSTMAAVDRLVERKLIRRVFAEDLFSTHLAEHAGYYGEMVWILTMLELWFEAHASGFSLEAGNSQIS